MLVATLKWRQQFKIEEIMKEEFDESIFGGIGYVVGHDKEGRPVKCVVHIFERRTTH